MHTFTALYHHRADAEAMQAKLQELGILDLDDGVPDRGTADFEDTESSRTAWGSPNHSTSPGEDRRIYDEAVKRGGFLLTVNVDEVEAARVRQWLQASNAVDVEERGSKPHAEGLAPTTASAAGERVETVQDTVRHTGVDVTRIDSRDPDRV